MQPANPGQRAGCEGFEGPDNAILFAFDSEVLAAAAVPGIDRPAKFLVFPHKCVGLVEK